MGERLRVDLNVVLPAAHGADDKCVDELLTAITRLDGVESVHIDGHGTHPDSLQLCLHVAPGAVSGQDLGDRVRALGARIDSRYGHLISQLGAVGNSSRANSLTQLVRSLPGVLDAVVTIEGLVRVEYDRTMTSETQILRGVDRLDPFDGDRSARNGHAGNRHAAHAGGQGAGHRGEHKHDQQRHDAEPGHQHHGSTGTAAVLLALAVFVLARAVSWFGGSQHWIPDGTVRALDIVATALSGWVVGRDVVLSLRARAFDIDQLMLIAAIGAALLGEWTEASLLLILFSLGHALEGFAMNRAGSAIDALKTLTPDEARLASDPNNAVPLAALCVGDVVVVRPYDRVPVDGVVVAGSSAVDESAVSGEPIPVDKFPVHLGSGEQTVPDITEVAPQHRAVSGTLNGSGTLGVSVSRLAKESTMARVAAMITEAETQVSPTQRQLQRIVSVFVPGVLVLAAATILVPPLFGVPIRDSVARGLAVLVASSPCALAIATPSAVLAAIARAAQRGVLIKGGGPLEAMSTVDTLAFDKTGTLTRGEPTVTDVIPAAGTSREQVLGRAYQVESLVDHPLARAITDAAVAEGIDRVWPRAETVSVQPGRGASARIDATDIRVGRATSSNVAPGADASLAADASSGADVLLKGLTETGDTMVSVAESGRVIGVIALRDTVRPEAAQTIDALRTAGISRFVVLSGDAHATVACVAGQLGIDDARGALMPADKVAAVKELRARGGAPAMVGDGVNDAPAMAAADVGIAMGASGNAVALETADIALMSNSIEQLSFLVSLSRRARRTIRQNLAISLGMVAVLVPATLSGVGIGPAVIAHEGSTLVVVANALLLLRFR